MKIDVFHDTVCPWCRIGKAHLTQALERWDGEPVEVAYRTFFLNPSIPPEGADFQTIMMQKGGGYVTEMEQFFARPREMGAQAGLTFNFEAITVAPNSARSHQLINLAPEDQREAVTDALYDAYFEHGRDIGDPDVLAEIGAAHGIENVRERIAAGEGLDRLQADVQWARQAGVSGVPMFVINGRYGFSGAQPPEVILDVMERVASGTLE